MGKGDKRTKRGKIFRGTKGNSRPKPNNAHRSAAAPRPKSEKQKSEKPKG